MLLAPDDDFPPYNFGTAVNNGDGTFAAVVVQPVGSCGQGSIDAFDLDGDGDRDVVLTEEQGCPGVPQPRIFVFRNDGNMAFVLAVTLVSSAGFARGMAGADLNGDGRLDLVTALGTGMGVFPNNGGFSFGTPVISSTSPYKFKLADFNNDGKLDVGMILDQSEVYEVDVATALGLGGGSFAPAQTQRGSNTAESLRISDDLDVADFDGDGHVDLLSFNYASNDVSVFLNTGNGALAPQQRYGIGNTPGLGTVADFNGDGRPDVAAAIGLPPSGLDNAIVLLLSVASAPVSLAVDAAGNGVLEPNETVVLAPTWRNTSAAALAVTGGVSNFTGPAGPTYTIVDAAADYGTIAAGDTASCGTDCYSLNIAASSRPVHPLGQHDPGDGDAHRGHEDLDAAHRRQLHGRVDRHRRQSVLPVHRDDLPQGRHRRLRRHDATARSRTTCARRWRCSCSRTSWARVTSPRPARASSRTCPARRPLSSPTPTSSRISSREASRPAARSARRLSSALVLVSPARRCRCSC